MPTPIYREDLEASNGATIIGFIQSGTGANARTVAAKLKDVVSVEDFGAVGNYNESNGSGTDDKAAIQEAIDYVAGIGGGTVRFGSGDADVAGKAYKTTGQITVKEGVRLDFNGAKLVAHLTGGNICAVLPLSRTIVENGHIEVISLGSPGGQAVIHAPIRVGAPYGTSGLGIDISIEDDVSDFVIRNMVLESDKNLDAVVTASISGSTLDVSAVASGIVAEGQFVVKASNGANLGSVTSSGGGTGTYSLDFSASEGSQTFRLRMPSGGAAGIGIIGDVRNGLIENIAIPDSETMITAIGMDWGNRGLIDEEAAIVSLDAEMTQNRANFTDGLGYTTHPHNIMVRNVNVGMLSRPLEGQDTGSHAVRLSGCYGITVRNVIAAGTTQNAFVHHAGDVGFEYARGSGTLTAYLSDGGTLTVSGIRGATPRIGLLLSGPGVPEGAEITGLGNGTGGTGTYTYAPTPEDDLGTIRVVTQSPDGANDLAFALLGNSFENCACGECGTGNLISTDSTADNVTRAVANNGYTALHPWGSLWPTDVRFAQVQGQSTHAAPSPGIFVFDQNGGVLEECSVSGFLSGVRVSGGQDLRLVGGRYKFNHQRGIYVGDGARRTILRDVRECFGNNASGSTYPNVYLEVQDGTVIDGGVYGTSGTETALHGIVASYYNAGGKRLSVINQPTILSHGDGGYALALGSGQEWGSLQLFEGVKYGPNIVNRYAGQTVVPVELRVNSIRYEFANGETLTGLTVGVGDELEYSNPTAGGKRGKICTAAGTIGTLNGGSTTGSISSGSKTLTVNSATGLREGQKITIAGVSGVKTIVTLAGTVATLDSNANANATSAAVAFSAATLKEYGAIDS